MRRGGKKKLERWTINGDFKALLPAFFVAAGMTAAYTYIFFGRILGVIPAAAVGVDCFVTVKGMQERKREKVRRAEFRSLLLVLATALSAGYSLEQAFAETKKELMQSLGKKTEVVQELSKIEQVIRLGEPVDKALFRYAERMRLEEVSDFADVISVLQKEGGNTVQVIEDTIQRVTAGMELKEEIETMIMSRHLELMIMVFMPAFMVLYLRLTNLSYMAPLYETTIGFGLMSAAVLLNVGADWMGRWIVYGETKTSKKIGKADRKQNSASLQGKNQTKYQKGAAGK